MAPPPDFPPSLIKRWNGGRRTCYCFWKPPVLSFALSPCSQLCSSVTPSGGIYGRMSQGARQDCKAKGPLLCRLPPLPLSVSLPAFISSAAFCVLEHDSHQPLPQRLQGSGNCMARIHFPKIVTAAGIPFSLPSSVDHLGLLFIWAFFWHKHWFFPGLQMPGSRQGQPCCQLRSWGTALTHQQRHPRFVGNALPHKELYPYPTAFKTRVFFNTLYVLQ